MSHIVLSFTTNVVHHMHQYVRRISDFNVLITTSALLLFFRVNWVKVKGTFKSPSVVFVTFQNDVPLFATH